MSLYRELHRPQFHFSARENWINDPNGLVYYEGIWHLFFQHNPEATTWGNMTWGHAVSDDLIHWRQLDHALYPDEHGTVFSGSAAVDSHNSAGFGANAILVWYTAAGRHVDPPRPYTQCLAYSTDGGATLTRYDGNPILDWIEADNRDPKVIWHEPTRHWIMALFLADDRYCLQRSPDGKTWTHLQDLQLEGDRECPDFFPLEDEAGQERWILWGANGLYQVGSFDGHEFLAETPALYCERGPNGYAAQTWSDTPDSRRIQISWMAGGLFPEMPFNHQMSIPVELSLAGQGTDVVLHRWPVTELEGIRGRRVTHADHVVNAEAPLVAETDAQLLDVSFALLDGNANFTTLMIRGQAFVLDWANQTLRFDGGSQAKHVRNRDGIPLPDGDIELRVLVDKTSVEVFVNGGAASASFCFLPGAYIHPFVILAHGGEQRVSKFELYELESTWP